ncbi:hypothetical protein D3C85_1695190 [compost metagenome]
MVQRIPIQNTVLKLEPKVFVRNWKSWGYGLLLLCPVGAAGERATDDAREAAAASVGATDLVDAALSGAATGAGGARRVRLRGSPI